VTAGAAAPSRPGRPRGVIFDLDGTLTEPLLDFEAIRREIGVPSRQPILEALAAFDPATRAQAEAVLRRREMEAIAAATLADGCRELLALLEAHGVAAAILTRNIRAAVDDFVGRFGLRFAAVFTREDGPPKPAPDGAQALCRQLGLPPADVWAVGDYKYDVMAGRDAGCRTVLVSPAPPADLAEWGSPDLVIRSLRELVDLWR